MVAPPSPSPPYDHTSMPQTPRYERGAWRGGPRPPIDRRTMTRDDLDDFRQPENVLAERLFAIALTENFAGGNAPQAGLPDRASRRWALDPETEQKWQHVLELHQPRLPHLETSSGPSSAVDSRVSFFGPREQRRPPRASPLTPHTPFTPFTPFTPYTPDTPELETPDDDVPGPQPHNEKSVDYDSDDDSFHGQENLITPFPLWQFPINPTPSGDHQNIAESRNLVVYETEEASLSYASLPSRTLKRHQHSETAPSTPLRRWRVVNADPQDVESSSDSLGPSSALPRPSLVGSPQATAQAKSLRPRLSIVTSVSRSRASTFSRDASVPVPPVSSSSSIAHNSRAEAPTLTQLLARKLTTDILLDKDKYRALLAFRGDEAQQILDCLQVLLDSPTLDGPDRTVILKALTRLSTYSGLYPRCFKLQDVESLGSEAVDEGRYGSVWRALSHGKVVCLKILRTYQRMPTQPLLKMLSHEALLWGQLSHPNILPFYGIHINEVRRSRFGLVSPWMENGNVVNYVKQNPGVPRIPLIHDIASGLQYLHSLNIVHGDIKGTNILVTSTGRACLADFGLSSLLGDNILVWSSLGSEPGRGGGTTRWKAPELFIQESEDKDSTPTPASDVYSFSCVAYEILTGQIPFYEIKGSEAVTLKLFNSREQPSRPAPGKAAKELTDEAWSLLEDCWIHEPDQRPSLEEVLRRLEGMMTLEQILVMRSSAGYDASGAGSGWDPALSSSGFRKSFGPGDGPSNEVLLKVISIIST